jgi:hypothetical protein
MEKFKNWLMYRQYASDEEVEKLGCFPYVVVLIILTLILYFKK